MVENYTPNSLDNSTWSLNLICRGERSCVCFDLSLLDTAMQSCSHHLELNSPELNVASGTLCLPRMLTSAKPLKICK